MSQPQKATSAARSQGTTTKQHNVVSMMNSFASSIKFNAVFRAIDDPQGRNNSLPPTVATGME